MFKQLYHVREQRRTGVFMEAGSEEFAKPVSEVPILQFIMEHW